MYLYNNTELQKVIMNEIEKNSSCLYHVLFIMDIKNIFPKNEKELKKNILKLIDKYLPFQKSSIKFASLEKVVVSSYEEKEKIEEAIEIFLTEAKKTKLYKDISIGAIIREKENKNLEFIYPQAMKALFYAATAGSWQYFFYSEEKEREFFRAIKKFCEFNEDISPSILIENKNMKNLFHKVDQFDPVTNLPTYTSFLQESESYINKNEKKNIAVFYVDIIGFKSLNRIYGEYQGNCFLSSFADYIQKHPSYIASCRVYADNFIGVFSVPDGADLEEMVESFIKKGSDFLHHEAHHHPKCNLGFICGVCAVDNKNESIYSYISKADAVRKSLKPSLTTKGGVFDEERKKLFIKKQELHTRILSAFENDKFTFYLQPKVDTRINKIIGAEALARMVENGKEVMMPGEFIPLMEETGDIVKLDFLIYKKVCAYIKNRMEDELPLFPISVNVSRDHFKNPHFVAQFHKIVSDHGIDPKYIELEITENVFVNNLEDILIPIKKLKNLGYCIQLDDFGSGYSSLNLLKTIPFDLIKLDKGFLGRGEISDKNKILIKGIIQLCTALDIPLLCEGVETAEQMDFLKKIGYFTLQGFYFLKPTCVNKFERLYHENLLTA